MPKYRVRIEETVEYVVDIEAATPEEASEKAVELHVADEIDPLAPEVTGMGVADRCAYAIELDEDGNEINDEEE